MKYRNDITGLRSIAVLSVVLCHIGGVSYGKYNFFQGGFIGVDIFFVISGYLITTILLQEIENKTFRFQTFYEKRIRRILPALLFFILLTLPFAYFLLDVEQLKEYGNSLASVTFFGSNIEFWKESGYFSKNSDLKPLLHTWSLGIEEQFYLFLPVFLLLIYKFYKKYMGYIFGGVIFVSLAFAIWLTARHPSASFFLLPSRLWEFFSGGLVAYLSVRKKTDFYQWTHSFLPILGLSMIFWSIVLIRPQTHHPSYITLIPILGTSLIIMFGGKKDIITRFLSTKLLVGIGLISYSFYLCHYPILAFMRLWNMGVLPLHPMRFLLLLIMLLLSYLSWRFVEQPCRKPNILENKPLSFLLVGGFLIVLSASACIYFFNGFPHRIIKFSPSLQASFVYGLSPDDKRKCVDVNGAEANENLWCTMGDRKKRSVDFMLIGDSHAYAMIPQFNIAAEDLGMKGITISESGCPPLLDIVPDRGALSNKCLALNNRVYEYVKQNKIKRVYLVARWSYYIKGMAWKDNAIQRIRLSSEKEFPTTLKQRLKILQDAVIYTISQYKKIGVKAHFIAQVPPQQYDAKEVYKIIHRSPIQLQNAQLLTLSMEKSAYETFMKQTEQVLKKTISAFPNALYHSFLDDLCTKDHCPIGTMSESYYWDLDHLSIAGSKRLVKKL